MIALNSGRLIAEKLKMSETTGQHVVLCPFHHNTETPSLSLDLDKAVFFCHSSCDEPKGGGVVEFLMKWSRIVDQQPITREQARRQLHRTFSVPNAKTLLREQAEEDLRLFAFFMPHALADALRDFDREIGLINEMWAAWPTDNGRKWKRLEELHKLRALYEWGFETCLAASKHSTDALAAAFHVFTTLGVWDTFSAHTARDIQRRRHAHLRRVATSSRPTRTPVLPEKGDLCRAITSPMKTKRFPVLSSTNTMTQATSPTRHPVR